MRIFAARASGELQRANDLRALEHLAHHDPLTGLPNRIRLRQLLDAGKASQLLEQYRDEAIGAWPFWKRGEGFAARGRAYAITKQGTPAEADLTTALEWISDPRQRDDVLLSLAQNAANNLHDENAALSRYHEIIDPAPQLGSSTQFEAVHGFATILSKRGQHDAALAVLQRVDFEKTGGFWRDQFRFWIAQTLQDAGKTDLAKASYEAILKDASTDPRLRKVIEEALHTENPH
jgi:tetratricopeptide (TPR) repeat protein